MLFTTGLAFAAEGIGTPNILVILADDLGYGDLGCYGHPYAKTPALDQLAKEGTRFTQAYVTGVTCCPSRTGMMTGKFPATFAKYMSDHGFEDRVTITELLKKNGYRTGHFGKWHIGPDTMNGTYGIDVINGKRRRDAKDRVLRGRDAVVIDGAIDTEWIEKMFPQRYATKAHDGILNPDDIAEVYWQIHRQPRSAWTHEMDLRPWLEKF